MPVTKLRDSYDWVVLGDHPGALLSASLAARLGLSVLLLPLASGCRREISDSGQLMDPEPNFMLGLGRRGIQDGLLSACLQRVGMLASEAEWIASGRSLPQVATPAARIDLGAESTIGAEIAREHGAPASAGFDEAFEKTTASVLEFWKQLPSRLTVASGRKGPMPRDPATTQDLFSRLTKQAAAAERRWLSAALAGNLVDKPLAQSLAGIRQALLGTSGDAGSMIELMHSLALSRTGATFRGGMTAYREFLTRLATRLGAHVPERAECRRIFVDGGRFAGVQIAHRGNMIMASGAILGCALEHALERVSSSGRELGRAVGQPMVPDGWRFTIAMTLHREAITPGMKRRLVWREEGAPSLEIEVVDPSEYGLRDPDHVLLFVRTMLPWTQESLQPEYQRRIGARMFRQLTELLPFVEYHVTRMYPDFRLPEPSAKAELPRSCGFASLGAVPENLRVHAGEGIGSRSGIDGLLVASGEAYPQLGTLGPTIAALEAVSWLAHRSGLAGPFA